MSTFRSSRPAVIELAARHNNLVEQLRSRESAGSSVSEAQQADADKALFIEMCEICLWGNATDLSLLTNLSYEDIQKLQGPAARKASEEKIVVNDLPAAFQVLLQARSSGKHDRRIDIVLDNAGFELFVDLILAAYLIQADLADYVVLHAKLYPWFVSDVTPKDFGDLLNVLADAKHFYETPSEDDKAKGYMPPKLSAEEEADIRALFDSWTDLHSEGKIILRTNAFWTDGGSFWRLPKTAPKLYEDLKESDLVLFKGDLNYRKLTADVSIMLHQDVTLTYYRLCGIPQRPSARR